MDSNSQPGGCFESQKTYVETACFDPQVFVAVSAMGLQFHEHHLSLNHNTNNNTHSMQQGVMINHHPNMAHLPCDDHDHHQNNSHPVHDHIFDFTHSFHHHHHQHQHQEDQDQNDHHLSFNIANTSSLPSFPQQTPDLLFNILPNPSTISLADHLPVSNPMFHLNLPPNHMDSDDACTDRGRPLGGKRKKPFTATDRERRMQLNNRYQDLRALLPNPTKVDKASIVGDAVEYIRELLRTVSELKLMVDKKRCERSREKTRIKTEDDDDVVVNVRVSDQSLNDGPLRSSWLQRKSKDTEVDVRVVDNEVTIKLIQRRKIDCLLFLSKVLDDLHLDLQHVAGGQIGDHCSFLFNTKMFEGSCVYAGAIANKILEVMDCKFEGNGVSSGRRLSNK